MWIELICGLFIYRVFKRFFYGDDDLNDLDSYNANALFSVAHRLEKLYPGGKVYIGLQIPDPDTASKQNIDLVLVTDGEAILISVKNISGVFSVGKDGNWVCTLHDGHAAEGLSDPVAESRLLASILEAYLEQRGLSLPEGYLTCKVICPNPDFWITHSDNFPHEVITHAQWTSLKPKQRYKLSGWIKNAFICSDNKRQESYDAKLNSILSTAPMWDRLEIKGNKHVLGEFIEFKGKPEDLQALRSIKRSKVSHLIIQKISMFGFAQSTLQILYTPRDYRVEGTSYWTSHWKEVTVRSSTEVIFQPQNSKRTRKYKLSSIASLSLSG